MSSGRWSMRGRASQGYKAAGRALADQGVAPATRFGRFVAGDVYQSGVRSGDVYQSGVVRSAVYQSGVTQGQVQ